MHTPTLLNNDPITVAKYLLGKELRSTIGGHVTAGIIIETEAYLPDGDAAAHNARGKTKSNSSLYKDAGTLYVHQLRQHILLDIVVGPVGSPGSVLIRALHHTHGIDIMQQRRGTEHITNLCSGPGKLSQALGITRTLDGQSLFTAHCPSANLPITSQTS